MFRDFPNKHLVLVPIKQVSSMEEIDELFDECLENEYEGQMIRLDGPYEQGKRSKYLLKNKPVEDAEFTVVDITEGIGNRAGMAGRCWCILPDGRTFKANIRGNREFLKTLLKDKDRYIGNPATVLYGNYTPDGIPRFGRVKTFWPNGRDV
jgi:ATP-dependent DNA ligase